jgi:hypothetical protein
MYHNQKITVMKKKDFLWSLLAILMTTTLSVGLSSCKDDEEDPFLTATANGGTNFDINGDDKTVDVKSNGAWTITINVTEGDNGWLSANTSGDNGDKQVTFTASKNTTITTRKATVKFNCTSDDKQSKEINFSQAGIEPALKVSPTSLQLEALGSKRVPFDIECNTDWTIDVDEDWLHVSTESGKDDETIEVYADDNKDNSKRTATITVAAKGTQLSKKVRVTQAEGENLVVTPLDPKLEAEKGSTVTISITANANWNISGTPSWVSLSSSQGGSGSTIVTITAKEKNFSEKERSANFTVTSGTKSATVTISQEPMFDASIKVNAVNELILSNGYYADLTFSNVLGYHEGYYYKYAFDVKTEEDIYNEVIEGEIYGSDAYNYTIMSGLDANTDFVYCCVPYSGDSKSRKYGKMLIQRFKTKSNSTYCDAAVTGSYNSSYWTYTISKQQRCHHYYKMYSTDAGAEYWYSMPPVMLALEIRNWINDKVNHPNYDYFLNDGTSRVAREDGDYAFFIWTWGVDDQNEFSGNIRGSYANLSATARQQNVLNAAANKTLKPVKKSPRAELNKMKKYLRIERK